MTNFLLSRSNSVEYGNSKTTRPTLLLSAKCTRPLFQGRTGCGGRSSGWHDIVTCQRLVLSSELCFIFYIYFLLLCKLVKFMIMIMIISLRRVLSTVRPSCVKNTVPSDRGKLVTLVGGVCVQHSSETRVTVLL